MTQLEQIVDDEKRYEFEELREKVLSHNITNVNDILDEAEILISPQKVDSFQNIKFIVDERNPFDDKLQRLMDLQKDLRYSGLAYNNSLQID